MATETINDIVQERGLKTLTRNLEEVKPAAERAERGVQTLNKALAAVGVAAIGRETLRLVDAYTTLQNRLKVVSNETTNLAKTTDNLFKIALKTRSPIEEIVQLYQKGALSAGELSASEEELFQFVEATSLALAVQGTAGAAAAGALKQFGQALGTQFIRAEEFNSLLEGGIPIAQAIANGIERVGGSVARLRQLVLEGSITSREAFDALISQQQQLALQFAKANPTIAGALTNLRTQLIKLVGEFSTTSGGALGLSNLILTLASNLDTLARVAGAAILLGLGRTLINAAAGLRALLAAAALNPFGAFLVALSAVISLIITFSDKITIGQGNLANLQDFAQATWEFIRNGLSGLVASFEENFGLITTITGVVFKDIDFSFLGLLQTITYVADSIVAPFIGAFNAIVRGASLMPKAIVDIATRAFNGLIILVEGTINRIIRGINVLPKALNLGQVGEITLGRVSNVAANGAKELGKVVSKGFEEGLQYNRTQDNLQGIIDRANAVRLERLKREEALRKQMGTGQAPVASKVPLGGDGGSSGKAANDNATTFKDILKNLKDEADLLQLSSKEREIRTGVLQIQSELQRDLTTIERTQVEQLLKQNIALAEQADILDSIKGPAEDYETTLSALNALLEKGKINLDEYNEKLKENRIAYLETQRDLSSGAERAFLKIARDASDTASQIESLLTNAFTKAEDVFVEFTKTGKLNFSDLVDSIEEDITRLAFRQLITAPLSEALGGAVGGGGLAGLFGGGGAANSNNLTAASPGGNVSYTPAGGGSPGFLSGISDLFGFANGGEFQVGGSGGTDSQLVAFRASPNETVKVTKPGQNSNNGDTIIINIQTQDAASFQRSDRQVLSNFASDISRIKKRNT